MWALQGNTTSVLAIRHVYDVKDFDSEVPKMFLKVARCILSSRLVMKTLFC